MQTDGSAIFFDLSHSVLRHTPHSSGHRAAASRRESRQVNRQESNFWNSHEPIAVYGNCITCPTEVVGVALAFLQQLFWIEVMASMLEALVTNVLAMVMHMLRSEEY